MRTTTEAAKRLRLTLRPISNPLPTLRRLHSIPARKGRNKSTRYPKTLLKNSSGKKSAIQFFTLNTSSMPSRRKSMAAEMSEHPPKRNSLSRASLPGESSTTMVSAAATPSAKTIFGSSIKCRRKTTVTSTPMPPAQHNHQNIGQGSMWVM